MFPRFLRFCSDLPITPPRRNSTTLLGKFASAAPAFTSLVALSDLGGGGGASLMFLHGCSAFSFSCSNGNKRPISAIVIILITFLVILISGRHLTFQLCSTLTCPPMAFSMTIATASCFPSTPWLEWDLGIDTIQLHVYPFFVWCGLRIFFLFLGGVGGLCFLVSCHHSQKPLTNPQVHRMQSAVWLALYPRAKENQHLRILRHCSNRQGSCCEGRFYWFWRWNSIVISKLPPQFLKITLQIWSRGPPCPMWAFATKFARTPITTTQLTLSPPTLPLPQLTSAVGGGGINYTYWLFPMFNFLALP